MTPQSIQRHAGLDDLPVDLLAALVVAEAADFQAGPDWYQLLCATAVAADERAWVHVLRRDGMVKAALPVLLQPARWGADMRALANFYTTRFTPPLADDLRLEDLTLLLRDLRTQGPRASQIHLAPMDKSGRAYGLLGSALRRAGYVTFEYFCFGNWYLPVTADCDTYMAARPGEVRSTLRRMSRRFAQAGGRIELVGPTGDVEAAVAAYLAVYEKSWKQPEPFAEFMPSLIRLCARKGWLRMGMAWMADKPIAAQLWVVAHGKASIFKLAYDSAHASLSPGTILTANLMRHVMEVDQVREVDYLTGDDAYKQAWMSHRREMWGIVGYDPRQLRGAALAIRELSARTLKRALTYVRGMRSRQAG